MFTAKTDRDSTLFIGFMIATIVIGLSALGFIAGIGFIVQENNAGGAGLLMLSMGVFVAAVYAANHILKAHHTELAVVKLRKDLG